MYSNFAHSPHSKLTTPPQPGEIWKLGEFAAIPTNTSGLQIDRAVMIVREVEPIPVYGEGIQKVAVMLLSNQTEFLSDSDVVIPAALSGWEQDLLAETWHIFDLFAHSLLQQVGHRLSRQVYDLLLDIGDYYHGLITAPPSILDILQAGLVIGKDASTSTIQAFHQQEVDWRRKLPVPFATETALQLTEIILDTALWTEQSTSMLPQSPTESLLTKINRTTVQLGAWFANQFSEAWQAIAVPSQIQWSVATRSASSAHTDEITQLLEQLSAVLDEQQRRRIVKRLGQIAIAHPAAIQALTDCLRTSLDDETLWTVADSLWHIDPSNPAAGVRRMHPIDLGMLSSVPAIALTVSIIQKSDRQIGVFLQVQPIANEANLPQSLKLQLLDESGVTLQESIAQPGDRGIQLKFSGVSGEAFGVRISLNEAIFTQDFVI